MEIIDQTASDLIADFAQNRVGVPEVVDALLNRIEAINPKVNAVCTVNPAARSAAEESQRRFSRKQDIRPLEGVPFVVKDVIQTKGLRTTFGSKIFEHHIPDESAISVERLQAAGGILLAKVNTPEFAHDVYTNNRIFGPTRNPFNLDYTAGGSSGGTAAAICAGMAPVGLGTDLGGSIRVPAAMCGIVGLRPSTGRVPVYPTDFGWDTLVTHVHGPMSRNVEDIGLMLDVLAGPDDRDPSSLPRQEHDYREAATGRRNVKSRRIAFSRDLRGLVPIEPEIADLGAKATEAFAQLGCHVDEACFDPSGLYEIIAGTRGFGMVGRYARLLEHRDGMNPHLITQVDAALKLDAKSLADAERLRTIYWHNFRRFMEGYDYMITPVIGAPAFRVGEPLPTHVGGKPVAKYYDAFRFPYAFSLIGVPAIAIPCGLTKAGLPVGIQIVGHRFSEESELEAAAAYMQIKPELKLLPSELATLPKP
jgi:amidase